jgi:hypothetical protein
MQSKIENRKSEISSYRPIGRIVLRRIGDDAVLVPVSGTVVQSNHLYPLNETGAFIWEHLNRQESPREIAAAVSRNFEVTEEEADTDCRAFIAQLEHEGLVEPVAK